MNQTELAQALRVATPQVLEALQESPELMHPALVGQEEALSELIESKRTENELEQKLRDIKESNAGLTLNEQIQQADEARDEANEVKEQAQKDVRQFDPAGHDEEEAEFIINEIYRTAEEEAEDIMLASPAAEGITECMIEEEAERQEDIIRKLTSPKK